MESTPEVKPAPENLPAFTPEIPTVAVPIKLTEPVNQELNKVREEIKTVTGEFKSAIDPRFLLPQASLRKKVIKILGSDYDISDSESNKVLWAHEESLIESQHKFKTRIHVYPSKEQNQPEKALMHITTGQKLDLGALYDVTDGKGKNVGYFKNKGLKTLFAANQWEIMDSNKGKIGLLTEIGNARIALGEVFSLHEVLQLIRKPLAPKRFKIYDNQGNAVASFFENRNPFVKNIRREVHTWNSAIDPRLITASHIMTSAIW